MRLQMLSEQAHKCERGDLMIFIVALFLEINNKQILY